MSSCCPTTVGPVSSDYKGVGKHEKVDDMELYVVGEGDKAVVVIYDIFGFHPNTYQWCDKLAAAAGVRVVMPDIFRGKPWPVDPWPPVGDLMGWIQKEGTEEAVDRDVKKVMPWLAAQGVKATAVHGFCWGGLRAFNQAATGVFKAVGTCHPSFVTAEVASAVHVPAMVLNSKDESDEQMNAVEEVLRKNLGSDKLVNEWFKEVHHGWCAARGDCSDPVQKANMQKALDISAQFFKKHLA
eukprot:GDKI01040162.1.p1 GENE.GDKI01040162.1~~GDKI01040162.1.p1  ORF type:complete len:259 (-),score=85.25 GDKI01040162.1:212-931(-)